MVDINHNLIKGCPLCSIFLNSGQKYLFIDKDNLKSSDFVIIEGKRTPIVVVRDHIDVISNSLWGRILYETRNLYGASVRLQCKPMIVEDHWHAFVVR
jgi:hypothetical protein